ncbi:MAG TPA: DUF2085 domain-containing protein [Pyrinomonadaceae bacterium]|nr:DUF2085 domain-containing protein [Pyrinomonadaceae bacterium]
MPASPAEYVSQFAPREVSTERRRLAWNAWACVAALALVWMGLIVGAPVLAARGHEAWAFVVYHGLGAVCHQMPERAFWLAGHPLGVCARCSGIYAGFTAAVLVYPLVVRGWRRAAAATTPRREWLIVALAPTAIDFTLGITGMWANTHSSRAITGAWLGAWMAFYIVPGFVEIGQERMRRVRLNSFVNKQEA